MIVLKTIWPTWWTDALHTVDRIGISKYFCRQEKLEEHNQRFISYAFLCESVSSLAKSFPIYCASIDQYKSIKEVSYLSQKTHPNRNHSNKEIKHLPIGQIL